MTAEQIKKLAAAGLSVEQISAVAEIMEPKSETRRYPYYPPGARGEEWPGKSLGLPKDHLVAIKPPETANDYGFHSESQFER